MLELYSSEPNTFFLKPLVALAEKGADYVLHYFDAGALEQFGPDMPTSVEAALDLEREGPRLRADGVLMSQSFFLLEYIADALPGPPLRPAGAYEAYRTRAWGQYLTLTLGSAVPVLGCVKYLAPRLAAMEPAARDSRIAAIEPLERRRNWEALLDGSYTAARLDGAKASLVAPLARIEKTLSSDPWLAGPAFSIADIDAYAMLAPLPDLAPDVLNAAATPRTVEFLARMAERPSVKAARATSRSGRPEQHFVPGVEPSRWG